MLDGISSVGQGRDVAAVVLPAAVVAEGGAIACAIDAVLGDGLARPQ